MNTIYLRLPQYVAAFYRGRDEDHPLQERDPVVFCEFSREHTVLASGLRIMPVDAQVRAHCYAQHAWNNMMRGRSPAGGMRIFNRDAAVWLDASEICTLEGGVRKDWQETFDYLCIGIPREVCIGNTVHRTNASYSLSLHDASALAYLLCNEFYMAVLDWLIQDRRFCNQKGIQRSRIESIERFLMRYNIPVSQNNKERETLRRQINRWLRKAYALQNDRMKFSDEFFRHVSKDEMATMEDPFRTDKK